MQLLFRKNIDRYCAYCQFAGRIDEAHMICQHCGVVPCEHHCRRSQRRSVLYGWFHSIRFCLERQAQNPSNFVNFS